MSELTPDVRLRAQVEMHEGFRPRVYDDATGKNIGPGTDVQGHPTIGIGRALDVRGVSLFEARWLLDRDLREVEQEIRREWAWFDGLDPVRKNALIELGFNLGIKGLREFRLMLGAIQVKAWDSAASELVDSRWATQVQPHRVELLTRQLRTGAWS